MRLLVISDAPILLKDHKKQAYAPYVKEMNIWFENVNSIHIVAPGRYNKPLLIKPFERQDIEHKAIRRLEFHTILSAIISLVTLPYQSVVLWNAIRKADHIHLRAPGNLCLLACFVQVLFPSKKKTVKYAGNWDPLSKQPFAYRLQKWLLSNTFLTRNIKVLVYGEWKGMTKNIKPFFTASYFDIEKERIPKRDFNKPLKTLFVGTMGGNKRPFETVELVYKLRKEGVDISLEMYGEGPASEDIKWYRKENGIRDHIILRGNQSSKVVKKAYQEAHFVILLSKSEGWPKVIAEAMFWGAIPIVSSVSCVPWMLDQGKRGVLVSNPDQPDIQGLKKMMEDTVSLEKMSEEAVQFSRQYTMDTFAKEIKKLL